MLPNLNLVTFTFHTFTHTESLQPLYCISFDSCVHVPCVCIKRLQYYTIFVYLNMMHTCLTVPGLSVPIISCMYSAQKHALCHNLHLPKSQNHRSTQQSFLTFLIASHPHLPYQTFQLTRHFFLVQSIPTISNISFFNTHYLHVYHNVTTTCKKKNLRFFIFQVLFVNVVDYLNT